MTNAVKGGNLVLRYRTGRISLLPWNDEDEQLLGALVLNLDSSPDIRTEVLRKALHSLLTTEADDARV